MEKLKEYHKHNSETIPNFIVRHECASLMRYIFNDKEFLPVQILVYLIIKIDLDNNIIYIIRQTKNTDIMNLSMLYLINEYTDKINNCEGFIGYVSKDCGINYYIDIIKTIYPDKDIKVVWGQYTNNEIRYEFR